MNWINIHTEILRGEEFIGAEPIERATWISLLGWCCSQENSGIIKDCREWGSRKWQQICGVTKEEISMTSELFEFNGDDLIISFYPLDQQGAVEKKRTNGKLGGRPKKNHMPEPLISQGEKPRGYENGNHVVNHEGGLMGNLDITLKESKVKESKEKKRKSNNKELIVPSEQEFIDYVVQKMPDVNPDWTPSRATRAAKSRYETYTESGWKDGQGKPIKNWKLKAKNAITYEKPWSYGSGETDKPKTSNHKVYENNTQQGNLI